MIGKFPVESFECTPIAYLSRSWVVIHVESYAAIVHDIMLGWKYDLGERNMKKCDRELLLARYCTWLATWEFWNEEVDEWRHNMISSTFRYDRFLYYITLKHAILVFY